MATRKFTDDINVALSTITALADVTDGLTADKKIKDAMSKIKLSADKCFDRLRMIKNAVDGI